MIVNLRGTWFVNGRRYRRGEQTIPDELEKLLPRDAVVISREPFEGDESETFQAPNPILAADHTRAVAEAQAAAEELAEANRQKLAQRRAEVEAALKAEKEAEKAKGGKPKPVVVE